MHAFLFFMFSYPFLTFCKPKFIILLILQKHGINFIGVNTRTKQESTPGYKDNFVRCSCSSEEVYKIDKGLKASAVCAINIKIG